MSTPASSAKYRAATATELRQARAKILWRDATLSFPHHGQMRMESDALYLDGWCAIPRDRVQRIDLTFTDLYTRADAGGGQSVKPGFFGSLGKPLVLTIEAADTIYLLLNWSVITGINANRKWLPVLEQWLDRAAPASLGGH